MDYRDLYKSRRITSFADSLAKRVQDINAGRQEKQREFFWSKRGKPETSAPSAPVPIQKKKPSRAEMLKKWKEEKMRKIEEAKRKQKPVFKVGVVQRKVTGSPLIINRNIEKKKNLVILKDNHPKTVINEGEKRQGVITRSRAKTMELSKAQAQHQSDAGNGKTNAQDNLIKFCKIDVGQKNSLDFYKFKVPEPVSELSYSMKLTFPFSPKITKKRKSVRETKSLVKSPKVEQKSPKQKIERNSPAHKVNKGNIKEENKYEEKSEVSNTSVPAPYKPSTPEADDYHPIHYSPFVTKRSDKKAGKTKKKSLVMDVDEEIKQEEKIFRCRIFSFRKYIECETKRLLEKCDKWKHIYEEFQEIPAEIEGDIDSVTGKTKLLTSDKFKQFKELIDKCDNGDPLINVDDLQGFQDWVSIEVEKIDEEFYKLEKKNGNNWQEETGPAEKKDKDLKMKKNKKASKPAPVRSNIRSHIQAARKLLKEEGVSFNPGLVFSGISLETTTKPGTPKGKESILKDVLNSETKKKNSMASNSSEPSPVVRERRNSGLEIMIATRKSKLSTPVKVSPTVLIPKDVESTNIDQTPAKSILRKPKKSPKSGKAHVTFKISTENIPNKNTGLNEKYFRPVTDVEESPVRLVLGDVGNLTPSRMTTRSRTSSKSERVSNSFLINIA